jgi:2-dehydro-3-deoxyphosphogluconate aldolase/(4S)-4-hydroxy-2-oxoglutarate aldolase
LTRTSISEAGARFLVTPGFNPEVVEHALARATAMLPGCCTPTEIEMARSRGLEMVKFFPAEPAGGAAYVRALAAPYASMRFIPTGGIDASKLDAYLGIQQVAAVGGSWMASRKLIEGRQFETITARTREAVEVVARLRPTRGVGN